MKIKNVFENQKILILILIFLKIHNRMITAKSRTMTPKNLNTKIF